MSKKYEDLSGSIGLAIERRNEREDEKMKDTGNLNPLSNQRIYTQPDEREMRKVPLEQTDLGLTDEYFHGAVIQDELNKEVKQNEELARNAALIQENDRKRDSENQAAQMRTREQVINSLSNAKSRRPEKPFFPEIKTQYDDSAILAYRNALKAMDQEDPDFEAIVTDLNEMLIAAGKELQKNQMDITVIQQFLESEDNLLGQEENKEFADFSRQLTAGITEYNRNFDSATEAVAAMAQGRYDELVSKLSKKEADEFKVRTCLESLTRSSRLVTRLQKNIAAQQKTKLAGLNTIAQYRILTSPDKEVRYKAWADCHKRTEIIEDRINRIEKSLARRTMAQELEYHKKLSQQAKQNSSEKPENSPEKKAIQEEMESTEKAKEAVSEEKDSITSNKEKTSETNVHENEEVNLDFSEKDEAITKEEGSVGKTSFDTRLEKIGHRLNQAALRAFTAMGLETVPEEARKSALDRDKGKMVTHIDCFEPNPERPEFEGSTATDELKSEDMQTEQGKDYFPPEIKDKENIYSNEYLELEER